MLLGNCFWFVVPVLLLDAVLTEHLPAAFQTDVFWHAIPPVVQIPESMFRVTVLVLPAFTPLGYPTRQRRVRAWLYGVGLTLYVASWIVLIVEPRGAWSTSAIGFMAPAWTPAIWLAGMAWLGADQLFVRLRWYRRWIFIVLSALFLVFHNLHTAIVWSRLV